MESLAFSLCCNRGLVWLILLDRGGLGGQVEQIIQRLHGCCGSGTAAAFQSLLVPATVTSEVEGWRGSQQQGVDLGKGAGQ